MIICCLILLAEFLSLSTSFLTFYLGMYLFVKPATDITAGGEIMISLAILTVNVVFFLYAAILFYRSLEEEALEWYYTMGVIEAADKNSSDGKCARMCRGMFDNFSRFMNWEPTDEEKARVQAHLDALTPEQRKLIAAVYEQRRAADELQEKQQLQWDSVPQQEERERLRLKQLRSHTAPVGADGEFQTCNDCGILISPMVTFEALRLSESAKPEDIAACLAHADVHHGVRPGESKVPRESANLSQHAMIGRILNSGASARSNVTVAHFGTTARFAHHASVNAAADIALNKEPAVASSASANHGGSSSIELSKLSLFKFVPLKQPEVVRVENIVLQARGSIGANAASLQPVPLDEFGRDGCISVIKALEYAKPLDLVAFVDRRASVMGNGGSGSSADLLRWTHVGVVVNNELLGRVLSDRADELYVLEAVRTMSRGDDEPCNIETNTITDGVQIRSLHEV